MTNFAYLSDGWLELESDPGLFTLLIEDFGCKNVQVEEIYDLSKVGLIEGHVYGFIFLFKWTEERRSRNRSQIFSTNQLNNRNNQQEPYHLEDENLVNSMFFAHQAIPNSCATHALLSVLLNCNQIDLGKNLSRFKEMTNLMDPESKGLAIGNMPELAKAHNQHASEIDTQEKRNKQSQMNKTNGFRQTSGDSFHFISFVNINNHVYELDGLKKSPIDHGRIGEHETFSEKFRQIILERIPQQQQKENKLNSQLRKLQTDMNTAVNEDIRYSLMAVVPDRRKENLKRLKLLKSKRSILLEILDNLTQPTRLPEPYETHSYSKYSSILSKNKPLEVNVSKLIVKDVNFNDQLNNKTTSNNSQNNSNNNKDTMDYDDSTDTCSECESQFGENDSCDEDEKIESLYAFKFVPLRNQNQNNNENTKKNNENKMLVDNKDVDNLKVFTKSELIDFYQDYGFKDLMNILSKIEQEISQCDRNITEEIEKRTKFYVDDSRRTHNYNDFITTYLLMITEQKKLADFVDSKDNNNKLSVTNLTVNSNDDDESISEDAPIKFFKEILTKYEDILTDVETTTTADHLNESKDTSTATTPNLLTNKLTGQSSSSPATTDCDQSQANKRKLSNSRRGSKSNSNKRKEKIK